MSKHLMISIIGKVIAVRKTEEKYATTVQEIIVRRIKVIEGKAVTDDYPIIFFAQEIKQFNPDNLKHKWVNVLVYLNGKSYPNDAGGYSQKVVMSVKDICII